VRIGSVVVDFDGGEFLADVDQVEAAAFAGFGWIRFRIFVDVVPFAAAVDGGTFQSKFQGVAIHLLKQRAAHAVAPDILRPAFARKLRGNVLNRVVVYAVALNEAHVGNGGLPAFFIYFVSENFR